MTDPRMTTTDAPVTVEQCDRDAAIQFADDLYEHAESWMTPKIERGAADSEPIVQAFARHRLAALASAPAGGMEPFGYWIEQKHAEPVLLRKPAYIPEPSDLRTVTPLYAAPVTAPAGDGVEEAEAVALLRRVAVNARFDWLGRDDCSAVRAALARPRAAVGEQSREEVEKAAKSLEALADWLLANDHDMNLPDAVTDDPADTAAMLRRLALQSPPAKVE